MKETRQLINRKGSFVLLTILTGVVAYYFSLSAYSLADASLVFPILRMSSVVSVLGGFAVFREERTDIPKKVISIAIILAGLLLISGYYAIF
jgi:uncharacterized membrane protein